MSIRTQTIDYLEKRRDVILMVQKNQKLSKVLKRELMDLNELIEEWNLIW